MQVDVTPQLTNPIRRVAETPHLGIASLCALAAVVGIVTGFGALLFRIMISFVHNLFFLKTISLSYDSSLFTPTNPWGVWIVLVPVAGSIIVTFIVANFAPEAKGHGVPEVMDAIYYKGGVIRPVVAVGEIPCIGGGNRQRCCGGSRRSYYSDRLGPRLDLRSDDPYGARPANHPGRRRCWCWYCRDLQHANRRRAVRHRVDAARRSASTPSCLW